MLSLSGMCRKPVASGQHVLPSEQSAHMSLLSNLELCLNSLNACPWFASVQHKALVWDAEDEPAKEASPANLEESPKSHPTTPSKRKTSPTVAQPSASNKSHKGISLLCCSYQNFEVLCLSCASLPSRVLVLVLLPLDQTSVSGDCAELSLAPIPVKGKLPQLRSGCTLHWAVLHMLDCKPDGRQNLFLPSKS